MVSRNKLAFLVLQFVRSSLCKSNLEVFLSMKRRSLVKYNVVAIHEEISKIPKVIRCVLGQENGDVASGGSVTNKVASDHQVSEGDCDFIAAGRWSEGESHCLTVVRHAGAGLVEIADMPRTVRANDIFIFSRKLVGNVFEIYFWNVHVGELGFDHHKSGGVEGNGISSNDWSGQSDPPSFGVFGVDNGQFGAICHAGLIPTSKFDA